MPASEGDDGILANIVLSGPASALSMERGAPHPTRYSSEALVRVRGDVTGRGGYPTFLPMALGRGAAAAGPALGSRLGEPPAAMGSSSGQAGCSVGEGDGEVVPTRRRVPEKPVWGVRVRRDPASPLGGSQFWDSSNQLPPNVQQMQTV